MDYRSISAFPQTKQQPTDMAIADLQPFGGFHLRDLFLLDLVKHAQSVSFSLAQGDSLRFHRALGHL
jgi:hypothetical protein